MSAAIDVVAGPRLAEMTRVGVLGIGIGGMGTLQAIASGLPIAAVENPG